MLARRLVQLYLGLTLFGVSTALLLRAELGLEPWGVLNQGVSELTGLTVGTVSVVIGALVLLLWIPLRQRPGLGTVSNVFVVGLTMDATLFLVPEADALTVRWPLLFAGLVLNGAASGLYIAAGFGAGPRDGLMTGLHRRTGRSIRSMRTAIEVVVVLTGFLLGGTVGAGTLLYALAIGPLVQFFLRLFTPAPAEKAVAPAEQATAAAELPAPATATGTREFPTPPPALAPDAAPDPTAVTAAPEPTTVTAAPEPGSALPAPLRSAGPRGAILRP